MDLISYLLGKKSSGGGGGGDASEYFNEFKVGDSQYNWAKNNYIKKLPDTLIIPDSVTDITGLFDGFDIVTNNAPKIIAGSNVTTVNSLFRKSLIKNVDLSGLDMSSINMFTGMFQDCTELLSVNFGNGRNNFWGTIGSMFNNCQKITEIDMSSISGTLTSCNGTFQNCYLLQKLDVRNLNFTNLTAIYNYSGGFTNVPNDCLIIVKDQANKDWFASKFPNLTNVQTVAEYEGN